MYNALNAGLYFDISFLPCTEKDPVVQVEEFLSYFDANGYQLIVDDEVLH